MSAATITFVEFIEVVRNLVLSISAAVGACVAWIGLKSWKSQKLWEDKRDVAKKILEQVYMHREWADSLRSPLLRSFRLLPKKEDREGSATSTLLEDVSDINFFREKLLEFSGMAEQWNLIIIESEMSFDSKLVWKLRNYHGRIMQLVDWVIPFSLKVVAENQDDNFDFSNEIKKHSENIFRSNDTVRDEFDEALNKDISEIESQLSDFLGVRK